MDFDICYIFCRKAPKIFEFLELPLIFYYTFHSYSFNFSFFSICGMLFLFIKSFNLLANTNIEDVT